MAWLTITSTAGTLESYIDARLLDELSNDANAATRDTTVIQELLDASKEFIQTWLAPLKRHTTPLTDAEVNASIRQIQASIVFRDLYARRGGELPQSVQTAYSTAIATLERIREGRQVVMDTDESTANANALPSAAERPDTDRDRLGLMADSRFYPMRAAS